MECFRKWLAVHYILRASVTSYFVHPKLIMKQCRVALLPYSTAKCSFSLWPGQQKIPRWFWGPATALMRCQNQTMPPLYPALCFSHLSRHLYFIWCRNPGLNTSCSGFLQKLSVCLLSQPDLALGAGQHGTQSSLAQSDFHTALLPDTVEVHGSGWSTVVSCERERAVWETVVVSDALTHWYWL